MTSPLQQHDHLDALEVEIEKLEKDLVIAQQGAGDIGGDEKACQLAEAEVMICRLRLEMQYRRYFRASRESRKRRCPIHPPDALVVTCPDCCVAWDYKGVGSGAEVIPLERGLELSAKLLDEAKAIGTDPAQAMRLVRWISELSEDERRILVRTAKRVRRRSA